MSANPRDPDDAATAWRELATVPGEPEARLIEGRLEAEGVDCQIESLLFTQEPVQFGLLGGVRLHVRESDLARARDILAELAEGGGAVDPGASLDEVEGDAR